MQGMRELLTLWLQRWMNDGQSDHFIDRIWQENMLIGTIQSVSNNQRMIGKIRPNDVTIDEGGTE